jgi:hypothetical protein
MLRPPSVWAVVASLLVLASCGADDASNAGPTTLTESSTTTSTSTTSLPASTSLTTTRPIARELRPDGIGTLRIGRDSANAVINELTNLFGVANFDGSVACESGSDRTVRWTVVDLTIVFNKSVWAGYLYGAKQQPPLTAVNGLAIGTTVGVLKAKYPSGFQIFVGSLGPEFSAPDGFRGFTSGTADSAAITQLGAGDICAFR